MTNGMLTVQQLQPVILARSNTMRSGTSRISRMTARGQPARTAIFPGPSPKLAEMVRRANQAIKAIDPSAKIICPATTNWVGTAGGTAEAYFTGMMSAATGDGSTIMKNWIDIVGVHLYIGGNDITRSATYDRPGKGWYGNSRRLWKGNLGYRERAYRPRCKRDAGGSSKTIHSPQHDHPGRQRDHKDVLFSV